MFIGGDWIGEIPGMVERGRVGGRVVDEEGIVLTADPPWCCCNCCCCWWDGLDLVFPLPVT